MSRKTVTTHFCDICGQIIHDYSKCNRMTIGVRFLTEQNEGTRVKPYYDYCIVDLCDECADKAITVDAIGAMGCNKYRLREKSRAQYGELNAENEKLREDLAASIPLPLYLDTCNENRQLKTENAMLRELMRKYGEYTDQDRCEGEGCTYKSICNNEDIDECWQLTKIRELERELGIEVE